MPSQKSLSSALSLFRDRVNDCIKSNGSILVTTHIDCDGLASGSIIAKALIRAGARCTVTSSKEFSDTVIEFLKSRSQDLCIVTDLGGGFASKMNNILGDDKWIILDHHQISDEEIDNPNVINSWKYDINGGREISAGGMAYMASMKLDEKNSDLSTIAVVSALGDRQDQGEKRSFVGKNFEIAQVAKKQGLLEVDIDLLLVGRETRPLSSALAYTSHPYIDGLTWNRDTCHKLLKRANVKLKEDGRLRVPAELDEDEKKRVIESIAQYTSKDHDDYAKKIMMSELIGYTYTFLKEDRCGLLRDAREFATMLNSCGKINRAGIGIAICMGNRTKSLQEGESILKEYKRRIKKSINILTNERWRISEMPNKSYLTINAQSVVQETMSGTIASIISGAPRNAGKAVILWTKTEEEEKIVKISARRSHNIPNDDDDKRGSTNSTNLGELMSKTAAECAGIGGGHNTAAGAKITKDKLDDFLRILDENISKMHSSDQG